MKKVVSLALPTWPTDRFYRRLGPSAPPHDQPVVLIASNRRTKIVHAANLAARRAGARAGMTATQAQALIPGLITSLADPAGDVASLRQLGLWLMHRYSPLVAIDPPDGVVLDATGASHLFGGNAAMLEDVTRRLASSGIAARCAMAPTWGAAWALARYSAGDACIAGTASQAADALADLPVSALRLDLQTAQQLNRLGLETIGEVNALPRAPLAHRFGRGVLKRLDQAYGRLGEPFVPLAAPEIPSVTRSFAEPISAPETLQRYARLLAEALAVRLEDKSLGALQIDLVCHRIDNRIEALRVGFSTAVRDAGRIVRQLSQRLDTLDPGHGLERMTLIASLSGALPMRPSDVLGEPPERDISELIDTLSGRIGAERIYRNAAAESEIPERSARRLPPLAEATDLRWPLDWPRPARLITPERIETVALLPDNPPAQFTWRGVRRRIRRADGPERVYGEWIRSNAELFAVRDYWMVEDEAGERFWLYRAGDGESLSTGDQSWFIHGVFG